MAHEKVYITDVQLARPIATERILCLSETTGEQMWVHAYPANYPDWAFDPNAGGPRATPTVRDGKIFTLGAMGNLFCLDTGSGSVVWRPTTNC